MTKATLLAGWLALQLLAGADMAAAVETAATDAAARPSADASPEEKRAYWQKRASERAAAAAEVGASPVGTDAAHRHAMPASPAVTGQPARGREVSGPSGADAKPSAAAPGTRWGGGRETVLWLTDVAMKREGHRGGGSGRPAAGMTGMAGMGETGPDGVPMKRVWLRAGGNPLTAHPATGTETALVQAPDGTASELPVAPHGGPYNVNFPTPDQGYYNVYLVRQALDRDSLDVTAAKAEVARASMGHGMAKEEAARLVVARTDKRVPVEIVRERKDKEALFTRVNYGDEIAFLVLRNGQPVQNARVTFASGRGWSNSVQSDEDGRAVFTVIRDYYPSEWRLFDKRHRETWLVAASFVSPESGEFQGGKYAQTRYTATLSGAYYPGTADYESYSDGLLIGMAGLMFTGSGVWWYRRRRVRPYREVRFDE